MKEKDKERTRLLEVQRRLAGIGFATATEKSVFRYRNKIIAILAIARMTDSRYNVLHRDFLQALALGNSRRAFKKIRAIRRYLKQFLNSEAETRDPTVVVKRR